MKCLAIDSSGLGAAVAVADDGELVARCEHDLRQGYAESLFGLFDAVLAEARWSRDDLDAVAVVEGPGSFTGLRVGVMTAKTLAHMRGWSLHLAHTHDLLASMAPPGATDLVTLQPAGRAHAYGRRYRRRSANDAWEAERLVRVESTQLEAWISESPPLRIADAAFIEALVARVGEEVARTLTPAAASLVQALAEGASAERWPARAVAIADATPLYAGPSQAERAHGIDLSEEIARPSPPVSWD